MILTYISGVALTDVRRLASTVSEAGAVVDVMTGNYEVEIM